MGFEFNPQFLPSSLFAGCRGGLSTFIRFRSVLRTRDQLFSSLVYRDLAFFQKTTAGTDWGALLSLSPRHTPAHPVQPRS